MYKTMFCKLPPSFPTLPVQQTHQVLVDNNVRQTCPSSQRAKKKKKKNRVLFEKCEEISPGIDLDHIVASMFGNHMSQRCLAKARRSTEKSKLEKKKRRTRWSLQHTNFSYMGRVLEHECTEWCSEIGSLTSLDARSVQSLGSGEGDNTHQDLRGYPKGQETPLLTLQRMSEKPGRSWRRTRPFKFYKLTRAMRPSSWTLPITMLKSMSYSTIARPTIVWKKTQPEPRRGSFWMSSEILRKGRKFQTVSTKKFVRRKDQANRPFFMDALSCTRRESRWDRSLLPVGRQLMN